MNFLQCRLCEDPPLPSCYTNHPRLIQIRNESVSLLLVIIIQFR